MYKKYTIHVCPQTVAVVIFWLMTFYASFSLKNTMKSVEKYCETAEKMIVLSKRIWPQSGELATYLLRGLLCATIDRRRSHPNNNKMCITVKFYYKTAN